MDKVIPTEEETEEEERKKYYAKTFYTIYCKHCKELIEPVNTTPESGIEVCPVCGQIL